MCSTRARAPCRRCLAAAAVSQKRWGLELFYSFRSPYSQLCLKRFFRLAAHYGVPWTVKPVLPMAMRGLATSVVSKGLCAELVLVVQYFIQRTARLHLALHSAVTLLPVATAGVDAALQRQRQGHTRRALPTQCT